MNHVNGPPIAVLVLWPIILSFLDYWEHVSILSSPASFRLWFPVDTLETMRKEWVRKLSKTRDGRPGYRKEVRLCGRLHCETGPAIEYADWKVWFLEGEKHRVDGPAVEHDNVAKMWYMNGKLHRVDGPAVEHADGSRNWYSKGKLHRVDGPAIEESDGSNQWYLEDARHRVDGPAIERPGGYKAWYLEGMRHRADGPAVEHPGGYKEWYLEGMRHRVECADGHNE